jgi:hypothetical protein
MKKQDTFLRKTMILLLAIAILPVSCSKDDPEPVDTTIVLSESAIHFTSKAENPKTIEVTGGGDWNVVEDLDWLDAEKQGTTLIVTAQPSRSLANRDGIITVVDPSNPANTADITVTQDHGTPKQYDYFAGGIPIEHLSPNGRYAAGEYGETGVVIDLYQIADEDYQPAVYLKSEHPELAPGGSFILRGIADDGTPFARGVTADGTTTLSFEKVDNRYVSYLVKNGIETPLESPSSYITSTNYQGVYVDLISADGKYILGRINADGATWVACKWTLNETSYVFGEIAPDSVKYVPESYKFNKWPEPANINGLSVLGEYSCGALRVPQGGTIFAPVPAKYTPYLYKMSDGSVTVLDEEINSRATFVTDDGTLFCATPYTFPFGADRTAYVYKNGTKSTFADWVNATYGLTVESNNGLVSAVAKDYIVAAWYTSEQVGFVNHFIIVEP